LNTRFRPTPYRDLHLGHVWVAWHNWRLAAASGGEFLFIADDIVYRLQYCQNNGFPVREAVTRNVEDLQWLGLAPTQVVYSSDNAEAQACAAQTLGLKPPGRDAAQTFQGYYVLTTMNQPLVMYHPWITATRVADDFTYQVNGFVRGDEWHLRSEVAMYDWFYRTLYGGNPPTQDYVPVVRREQKPEKESKAVGATTIRDLRATGYSPAEILETLQECAARSSSRNQRDLIIPEGVLDTDTKRALRLKNSVAQRWREQAASYAAETAPWAIAATQTVKRTTGRLSAIERRRKGTS
jgi:glutamyl/glutaminyl-tRNA synthetase